MTTADGSTASSSKLRQHLPTLDNLLKPIITGAASKVDAFIDNARDRQPGMTDAQLLRRLEVAYVSAATAMGAAAGATAAAPWIGIPLGLTAAGTELTLFSTLTLSYVLAVAKVNGHVIEEYERQKALLFAALSPGGAKFIEKIVGHVGPHWGNALAQSVPLAAIRRINKIMGPYFVTRFGTQRGLLVLGKLAPAGVGAALGGSMNAASAKLIARGARKAFAPLVVA